MQMLKLPKRLDPHKSSTQRSSYEGLLAIKDLSRLAEAVVAIEKDVEVKVKFDTDAQGLHFFDGTLTAQVQLSCERCDEPFLTGLDLSFCFCPVRKQDNADEIPDVYDTVEVDDHGEIDLLQLLEDELILALPIVALHDEQHCKRSAKAMSFGKIDTDEPRPNPFAVLKELKRDEE